MNMYSSYSIYAKTMWKKTCARPLKEYLLLFVDKGRRPNALARAGRARARALSRNKKNIFAHSKQLQDRKCKPKKFEKKIEKKI